MRMLLVMVTAIAGGTTAWAAPAVDGAKDAAYGSALAVQTVQTGFQDNLDELNAAYGVINGGRLYLMLTGNLRDNFNRLEIFIDSAPGGQNVYQNAGNDNTAKLDGLVFDAGFTADYHLIARRGDDGGNLSFDLDFADLGAAAASSYADMLGGLVGSGATTTGVNAQPIHVGYDDSNVAGVGGDAPNAANQAAALAVLTGFEISIDLDDLGYLGGPIRVMAGINNQFHDFWSNQFLAGISAPQINVGGDGQGTFTGTGDIDMTQFRGDQFFTVIPEPSSLVILAFGLVGCIAAGGARSRRRIWPLRSLR